MLILEWLGISVAVLLVALVGLFVRRRLLMQGGGSIKLQVRLTTVVPGRGWSPGIGVFADEELRFYRMFSFSVRPKRVLDRQGLVVLERRRPEGPERLAMPGDWEVLRCTSFQSLMEIAMAASTMTGFLSWLEAGPPGQPGSVTPHPGTRTRPADTEPA
jgi:hypothetical protein